MKRLPWLSVVVTALSAGPLLAQPINILDRSVPLSRRALTMTAGAGLTTSDLLDTDLVLAGQAHLPYAGEMDVTATAAQLPVLGYVRPSPAATTPNVNPFVSTALAKYHGPTTVKAKPTSTALTGTTATAPLASSSSVARMSWRLGSRYQPPPSGSPVTPLPPTTGVLTSSGGSSGLGRGTIFNGGTIPLVGIPEPSTYLLCGMVVVLGGYWHLRRRARPVAAPVVVEKPVA